MRCNCIKIALTYDHNSPGFFYYFIYFSKVDVNIRLINKSIDRDSNVDSKVQQPVLICDQS